jgi:hypothetical protein
MRQPRDAGKSEVQAFPTMLTSSHKRRANLEFMLTHSKSWPAQSNPNHRQHSSVANPPTGYVPHTCARGQQQLRFMDCGLEAAMTGLVV